MRLPAFSERWEMPCSLQGAEAFVEDRKDDQGWDHHRGAQPTPRSHPFGIVAGPGGAMVYRAKGTSDRGTETLGHKVHNSGGSAASTIARSAFPTQSPKATLLLLPRARRLTFPVGDTRLRITGLGRPLCGVGRADPPGRRQPCRLARAAAPAEHDEQGCDARQQEDDEAGDGRVQPSGSTRRRCH
jgi:hypothetical protein